MRMTDIQDPRWVVLKPSLTNLILTLAAGLAAMASLWLIDLPAAWRGAILLLALVVLAMDVYLIRCQSRDAVAAFYLYERDVALPAATGNPLPAQTETARELLMRIRYANPARRRKGKNSKDGNDSNDSEALGVVLKSPYVSTYFTTIPYRLPHDAPWRRWFPRVLAIWADSVDAEQFRQVRVRLKWR